MNIFLDLDQTAILSLNDNDINNLPHSVDELAQWPVANMDNEFMVFSRPGLSKFLDYLFQNHRVSVWSAASRPYVLHIVRHVIQQNRTDRPIRFILWDEHCRHSRKHYKKTKDLRLLWERYRLPGIAAGNTVLIDDLPSTRESQPCYVVPIEPFEALDPDDQALEAVIERLRRLAPTGECPLQPEEEKTPKKPQTFQEKLREIRKRKAEADAILKSQQQDPHTFRTPVMDTIQKRSEFIDEFEGPSDGARVCLQGADINGKRLQCFKNACILERIGEASVNAAAYKMCYPLQGKRCGPIIIALKSIRLTPLQKEQYQTGHYRDITVRNEIFGEVVAMELCTTLVRNRTCPNLPMYFRHNVCKETLYILNEYASGGTIEDWITEKPRSYMEWMVMLFHVFAGIRVLQKYCDLSHHDLHANNILYHPITPGGDWEYTLDGQVYGVPNNGVLWVLWDFGQARIPFKIEPVRYKDLHHRLYRATDDYRMVSGIPRHMVALGRIALEDLPYFFQWTDDQYSPFESIIATHVERGAWIEELIPVLFGVFTDTPINSPQTRFNADASSNGFDIVHELKPFFDVNYNILSSIAFDNPSTETELRKLKFSLVKRYRKKPTTRQRTAPRYTLKRDTHPRLITVNPRYLSSIQTFFADQWSDEFANIPHQEFLKFIPIGNRFGGGSYAKFKIGKESAIFRKEY